MAVYQLKLYDADPYFILSRTLGGEAAWTGSATATGDATVTDNGPDDTVLGQTDTATADVTFGGATLSGVAVFASESWTVRDTVTGETFQVATFAYDDGGTVYRTLSELPLVAGRTYETIAFDTTPSEAEGTAFDMTAFTDASDGVVEGTAGADTIDAGYAGDPEGDVIDGQDAGVAPTDQELNWSDYVNGQDLSGGITQDTGLIDVTLTASGPAAAVVAADTDDTIYVAPGETFATASSLFLNNDGSAQDVDVALDFAATAGATGIRDEVQNVQFRISDLDRIQNGTSNFQDLVLVRAFDADGNAVDVTLTVSGDETVADGSGALPAGTIVAGPSSNGPDDADGSVLVGIAGPVARIEITYDNGGDTNQFAWVSDIQFQTIPIGADDDSVAAGGGDDVVLAGEGQDTVLGEGGADTLDGGAGDDSLVGGDGADSLEGGAGSDSLTGGAQGDVLADLSAEGNLLDGGSGADTLTAGVGDDTLIGGSGADVIDAGGGADAITAGGGNDLVAAGAGADTVSGGGGRDTIDGGDGADDLAGGDGDDSLTGGAGADTLTGDGGDDTLDGGEGPDDLSGGAGADDIRVGGGDIATGGDGDDTFTIDGAQLTGGGTIDVVGGEGDETGGDTLFFNGLLQQGSLTYTNTDDAAGGFSGTATLLDGTTVTFTEIENIICFAAGTRIATPQGDRPVESLRAGDMVLTRDDGPQPLQWVGRRAALADASQAPVTFAPGTMGNARPLRVSPQHRMLVGGWRAQLYFGADEVLVPAVSLCDGDGIRQDAPGPVVYHHLLTPRHAVIAAEGAAAETFLPAAMGLDGIDARDRAALFAARPDLRADLSAYGPAARPTPRARLARLLAA